MESLKDKVYKALAETPILKIAHQFAKGEFFRVPKEKTVYMLTHVHHTEDIYVGVRRNGNTRVIYPHDYLVPVRGEDW